MLKTVNIGKNDKDLQEYITKYQNKNKGASVSKLFKDALRFYIENSGKAKSSEHTNIDEIINNKDLQNKIVDMLKDRLDNSVVEDKTGSQPVPSQGKPDSIDDGVSDLLDGITKSQR